MTRTCGLRDVAGQSAAASGSIDFDSSIRGHRPLFAREKKMLRTLFSGTILAGALAGTAMAQAPDAGCALPSEPKGIPAAIDAAITGPADKDRACMKALLIPEARMMFVSLSADGAPSYCSQSQWAREEPRHCCTMMMRTGQERVCANRRARISPKASSRRLQHRAPTEG